MYIHIDCNSFFVSCELVSRPQLEGTPVVVANDNDAGGGIILALNKEAKAIGLKRGNPLFQVREVIERYHVTVIDVHHKLYHAISEQIMQAVKQSELVLDFVQYSVDEFFGFIPEEEPKELRRYLQTLMDLIKDKTHIPVSCGAGSSYTMAKTATYFAKRYDGYRGICIITEEKRQRALELIPVNDVWGIGRRSRKPLEMRNIRTAWDYSRMTERAVNKLFGIRGVRIWMELNGKPAIPLGAEVRGQRSIMHSRTFARMIIAQSDMEREISNYAMAASAKLRAQQSLCNSLRVFIATNRNRTDLPQYKNEASMRLKNATDDSSAIISTAIKAFRTIFQNGYYYKQAGVILEQLQHSDGMQMDLFEAEDQVKKKRLMRAIDDINRRFGDNQIHFGIQGEESRSIEPAGFTKIKKIK